MLPTLARSDLLAPSLRGPCRSGDLRPDRAGLGVGYGLCRRQLASVYGAVAARKAAPLNYTHNSDFIVG